MILTSDNFPAFKTLEAHWLVIRKELDRLGRVLSWPQKFQHTKGWDAFWLYLSGEPVVKHSSLCPETSCLLAGIPGLSLAGFSSLAPHSHLKPRLGACSHMMRCHMGLYVPQEATFKLDGTPVPWPEGKCLIFNATCEQDSYNRSNETRIVLLVEFLSHSAKPQLVK